MNVVAEAWPTPPLESQIGLERRLARIRWFGVALGIYLMAQVSSQRPPLPSGTIVLGSDAMILALGVGNVALQVLLSRDPSPRALRTIGAAMFGLDCLVIVVIVWLFGGTPKDATWALLYVLPLEAALRYEMVGALACSAGLAVSEIAREAFLAEAFPRIGFVIPDVAFRVGVGVLIGAVAGLMCRSLRQEAEALRALSIQQAATMERLAEQEAETRQSYALLRRTDEQRREVMTHLLATQEQERRHLATRLRDDPLQQIVAAGMRVAALRTRLADPDAQAMLAGVGGSVDLAIASLRTLLFELAPSSADRLGLVAALKACVAEMDPSPTVSTTSHLIEDPPADTAANLYRIAQGAIVNAARNGEAAEIEVLLRPTEGGLYLRVSDDGCGVREGEPDLSSRRLSLRTIRERAELSGGWFHLLSALATGSIVECWLPAATLVAVDR